VKLATWNVNSLKIRLPHVLDWLVRNPVDVVAIQETKLTDDHFPKDDFEAAGYASAFAGQKTYNGVAILTRLGEPATDVVVDNPRFPDVHRRVIGVTVAGMRVVCVYVPNGQSVGSDKYAYKLAWMKALGEWLADEVRIHPRLAVMGDYNVAPEARDVHDPRLWEGQVMFSAPEREALAAIASVGLVDAFRLFEQPEKSYSWWDYRMLGFQKGRGLRIDHILLSDALAKACTACTIDRAERKKPQPSDHAPVIATLDLARI